MFDDFDEFENEELDQNDPMIKAEFQQIYDKMIDHYVRSNYEAIKEKGLDVQMMSERGIHSLDEDSLQKLKDTLVFMINYFVELEEYEKCAVLQKYVDQI